MRNEQLKELGLTCLSMRTDVDENTAYINFISQVEPENIVNLIERMEATERERDELITQLSVATDRVGINFERAKAAEAELARRDAAAGEPFAYARRLVRIASGDAEQWKVTRTLAENSEGMLYRNEVMPLYTTLPASSVPDGLVAAVNRLLDSDGSRGTFSAIRRGNALEEVERLLAAAPAPGGVDG